MFSSKVPGVREGPGGLPSKPRGFGDMFALVWHDLGKYFFNISSYRAIHPGDMPMKYLHDFYLKRSSCMEAHGENSLLSKET